MLVIAQPHHTREDVRVWLRETTGSTRCSIHAYTCYVIYYAGYIPGPCKYKNAITRRMQRTVARDEHIIPPVLSNILFLNSFVFSHNSFKTTPIITFFK